MTRQSCPVRRLLGGDDRPEIIFILAWPLDDRRAALTYVIAGATTFELYRGVVGPRPARKLRGLGWTADRRPARWARERWSLRNPAADLSAFQPPRPVTLEGQDTPGYRSK